MEDYSRRPRYQWKIVALVVGLVALALIATGFTIFVVQTQSAVAAYFSGQSAWNRGQLSAVFHLDHYARSGDPDELAAFEQWIAIPLADLEARKGMEQETLDMDLLTRQFLRGQNHPDSIPGMIRLYRNFSSLEHLRQASEVWQQSDADLIALQQIARELEAQWAQPPPDAATLARLHDRIDRLNEALGIKAHQFREVMGEAGRFTSRVLTWVSVVFITLVSLGTWLIGARLLRVLRRSELRFRTIFEQSSIGILQINNEGKLLDANPASCKILGYPARTLRTLHCLDLVHPEDRPAPGQPRLLSRPDATRPHNFEKRIIKGNGETIWARVTVSQVNDGERHHPYYILMLEDISEAHRLSRELTHQATHDALTDLLNRRAFEHRLASVLGRARTDDTVHALAFVDLDRFKAVNDISGHAAGDQLLRQVSQVIRGCVRDGDVLARLGGDEFGLILENCDLETAARLCEKVRDAVDNLAFTWNGRRHNIGCSIGVVPVAADIPDISTLMRTADQACYRAKHYGRNQVCLAPPLASQPAATTWEEDWQSKLEAMLEAGRLSLDGQRIYACNSESGEIRYEVLLRLTLEDGTIMAPGNLLPKARQLGFAHRFDEWVIREVISQLAAHRTVLEHLTCCHINVSVESLQQPDFPQWVLQLLKEHRIAPGKLCFEVNEEAAIQHLTVFQQAATQLRAQGCQVLLQQFGNSFQGLDYLSSLPIDLLKLDSSFASDLANSPVEKARMIAIRDVCQALGIRTIASHVESEHAASLLRYWGINYLQGLQLYPVSPFSGMLQELSDTMSRT